MLRDRDGGNATRLRHYDVTVCLLTHVRVQYELRDLSALTAPCRSLDDAHLVRLNHPHDLCEETITFINIPSAMQVIYMRYYKQTILQ